LKILAYHVSDGWTRLLDYFNLLVRTDMSSIELSSPGSRPAYSTTYVYLLSSSMAQIKLCWTLPTITNLCSESANLRQGVWRQPKVIRDSDPDLCMISPTMWIDYIVLISHFAECRENRPVTVWEMLINLLKILYSATVREVEKWSVSGTGSPPKVNKFFRSLGPFITPSVNVIGSLRLQ